jgi:hypothetical protein
MIFEGVERAAVQLGGEVAGDTIDLFLATGERSPAAVRKGNVARQLATAIRLSRAIFSPEVFGCAGAGAAGAPSRSGVSVRSKRTS